MARSILIRVNAAAAQFVAGCFSTTAARPGSSTPVLIFDADCGVCARFVKSNLVCSARVNAVGYQFIEHDADLCRLVRERGIDRGVFTRAMVLIDGNRVTVGARAFNTVLRRHGGWQALAAVALSLPLVSSIEILMYRVIAARRSGISAWLGTSICTRSNHDPLDFTGGS